MGFGVNAEESVGDLIRFNGAIIPISGHLAFARTRESMGIDCKQAAVKVTSGATQATQGELQSFGLLHRMSGQQIVNALI